MVTCLSSIFLSLCIATSLFAAPAVLVQELTSDAEVFTRGVDEKPLIIDFFAEWCTPCRGMKPVFEQVAQELKEDYRFAKADIDKMPALAEKCAVESVPTFVVVKGDKVLGQITGTMSAEQFKGKLQALVSDKPEISQLEELDKKHALDIRLLESVQAGDVDTVKQLIASGANVNVSLQGVTPLVLALIAGMSQPGKAQEIVSALLDAGCSQDIQDQGGKLVPASTVVQGFIEQYSQSLQAFKEILQKLESKKIDKR